jgi:PKD repeat protein
MKVKNRWNLIKIILAMALFFIVIFSFYVTSDVGVFSTEAQNVSLCNVQGYIFGANNQAIANSTNVTCTLARNNNINTTYNTTTGNGFPDEYNNSYRCTMMCSNVISDSITVSSNNATDVGVETTTMSGSTSYINITFTDSTSPTINGITGNASLNVSDSFTIQVNTTDNGVIAGTNVTLSNGSIVELSFVSGETYQSTIIVPSNDTTTISYYAITFDNSGNNATSETYYINIIDNVNPSASIESNATTVDQDETIQFNASASTDNVAITNYSWDFGDGNTSTNAEPTHFYISPGSYNVELITYDAANNNDTNTTTITVRDSIIPTILSNIPTNDSLNISLDTNINITFSEAIQTNGLNNENIQLKDANDNQVYCNISFSSNTNKTTLTPYIVLNENMVYTLTLTNNIQDSTGNNLTTYAFNFTTKAKDTDNDGIPDSEETDDDNDGILDVNDRLVGNSSNIKTTYNSLSMTVNGSTNTSQEFNFVNVIEIQYDSKPVIKFNVDLSSLTVDLDNISIYESENSSVGELLVHGLELGGETKSLYLTRKSSYDSVCVKDTVVTAFSSITEACTGSSETKVYCNGTSYNSYTCLLNATTGKYEITGLSYSGVREIDYTPSSDSENNDNNGGGGSGGGGGGGGGDTACYSHWQCTSWSDCKPSGMKSRNCNDINSCIPATGKPLTSMYCVYIPPASDDETIVEEEIIEEYQDNIEQEIEVDKSEVSSQQEVIEEDKNLGGKAYDAVKGNSANAYFLMFIVLIAVSVAIFHTIHKKKD